MDPSKLYLMMLPVFFAAIALEALYYRVALHRPYGWKVTTSNLAVAIGRLGTDAFTKALVAAVYVAAYQLRPFDIPLDRWEGWVALFLAVELAYYWLHRFSHQIRWMWAQHSVHHSARQITLSVAYRLGWTQFFAGPWLFLVPVCWIGFDPRAVSRERGIVLPRDRDGLVADLHHAVEPEYLDRNYGGVLILWDRLFGTYARERDGAPRTYGLVRQIDTLNPVKIVFAEWVALFRDLRAARSLREALGLAFGPPGWRSDGSGRTTRAIRRAAGIPEDSRARAPLASLAAERDASG